MQTYMYCRYVDSLDEHDIVVGAKGGARVQLDAQSVWHQSQWNFFTPIVV